MLSSSPSSSSSPLSRIPFIQKILYFTCIKVSDPVKYSHVSSSWRETLCSEEYGTSVTIWSRKYKAPKIVKKFRFVKVSESQTDQEVDHHHHVLAPFPPKLMLLSDAKTETAFGASTLLDFSPSSIHRRSPSLWHPTYAEISRLMVCAVAGEMLWVIRDLHKAGFPVHGPCLMKNASDFKNSKGICVPGLLTRSQPSTTTEPLRFAAWEGKLQVVKFLLKNCSYSPYHYWQKVDFVVFDVIFALTNRILNLDPSCRSSSSLAVTGSLAPKEDTSMIALWFEVLNQLIEFDQQEGKTEKQKGSLLNHQEMLKGQYSPCEGSLLNWVLQRCATPPNWSHKRALQQAIDDAVVTDTKEDQLRREEEKFDRMTRLIKLLIANDVPYFGAATLSQLSQAQDPLSKKLLSWFFSTDFIRTILKVPENQHDDDDELMLRSRFMKEYPLFLSKNEESVNEDKSYLQTDRSWDFRTSEQLDQRWSQSKFFYIILVRRKHYEFAMRFISDVLMNLSHNGKPLVDFDISGCPEIFDELLPPFCDFARKFLMRYDDEIDHDDPGKEEKEAYLIVDLVRTLTVKANASLQPRSKTATTPGVPCFPLLHRLIERKYGNLCRFLIVERGYKIHDERHLDAEGRSGIEFAREIGWSKMAEQLEKWSHENNNVDF